MTTTERTMASDGSFVEVTSPPMANNIEVTLGARGQVQYSVKLYFKSEDREKALDEMMATTDMLDQMYASRLAKGSDK